MDVTAVQSAAEASRSGGETGVAGRGAGHASGPTFGGREAIPAAAESARCARSRVGGDGLAGASSASVVPSQEAIFVVRGPRTVRSPAGAGPAVDAACVADPFHGRATPAVIEGFHRFQ